MEFVKQNKAKQKKRGVCQINPIFPYLANYKQWGNIFSLKKQVCTHLHNLIFILTWMAGSDFIWSVNLLLHNSMCAARCKLVSPLTCNSVNSVAFGVSRMYYQLHAGNVISCSVSCPLHICRTVIEQGIA